VHPDKQHHQGDHNLYRTLSDTNRKAADAKISSGHVNRGFKVFRHIPCIVSALPRPDHLHSMQIGMLDHLQKLRFHFMKTHKLLDKYNAIWLSVPSYYDLTPRNKSCEDVSQWNGKKTKKMSWSVLGVVTQSLRGGSRAQLPIFNRAIECTWA